MQSKTVTELRVLARTKGIKGYSRMCKDELIRALEQANSRRRKVASRAGKNKAKGKRAKAAEKRTVTKKKTAARLKRSITQTAQRAPSEPPAHVARHETHFASEEERIEDAKFVMTLPGIAASTSEFAGDLDEDIESLPDVHAPGLSLLPQKPGVLHAYWFLPSGRLLQQPKLRLRLCHVTADSAIVLEEIPVPADQGQWYFHIEPSLELGELYLQLGYYHDDGEFVTAIREGAVRLPRLYAASRTDRDWWISEKDFRRMYTAAGGILQGGRLAWRGDVSSSR